MKSAHKCIKNYRVSPIPAVISCRPRRRMSGRLIAREGGIDERDMFNTYNMGVGMSIVVDACDVDLTLRTMRETGVDAYVIGEITASDERIEIC